MSFKINSLADLNFLDVIKSFNKLRLPYWCMHGTLLGLVRDGDLIHWDRDIDLAFEFGSVDIKLIMTELERLKFTGGIKRRRTPGLPVLKYSRSGGRVIEISFFQKRKVKSDYTACFEFHKTDDPTYRRRLSKYKLFFLKILIQIGRLPIHEKELKIDYIKLEKKFIYRLIGWISRIFPSQINFFSKWLSVKCGLDSVMGYYVPISLFGNGTYLNYHGKKCRAPKQLKAVCETLYGKNWQKPIESNHWTQFHKR